MHTIFTNLVSPLVSFTGVLSGTPLSSQLSGQVLHAVERWGGGGG